MVSIMPLSATMICEASEMAARAFQDDPMGRYLIPNDADRLRLTPRLSGMMIHFGMRYGQVETTGNLSGLAVWVRPEYAKMTLWRMLLGGLVWGPLRLGVGPFRRLMKAIGATGGLHKHAAPKGPHWYLQLLAVDPAHQRKGIGGALLQHGLARADADGLPCYLETTNSANVTYYERYGFKTSRQAEIPGAGFTFSGMVRQPRASTLSNF